jgi:hypothetical protein
LLSKSLICEHQLFAVFRGLLVEKLKTSVFRLKFEPWSDIDDKVRLEGNGWENAATTWRGELSFESQKFPDQIHHEQ